MSFDKLNIAELRRTAEEDFAVELSDDEKKSKKLITAALLESGVTFEQYLVANPHQREVYAPETIKPADEPVAAPAENVVTSEAATLERPVEIVVKEEVPLSTQQQWLVKMERQNPLFEIAGHRFTKEHPYVLMDAADADVVLREDGFRQAYPSEIAEYYG